MPRWFPVVSRRTITTGGGVVQIPFEDSFALDDTLSAELGPVNTEDTIDLADMLVVSVFNAQDMIGLTDDLAAISGLVALDTIDLGDVIAFGDGQINAGDTIDLSDMLVVSTFDAQDSLAISDEPDGNWTIDADPPDSFALPDDMAALDTDLADTVDLTDDPVIGPLTVEETLAFADEFNADSVDLGDSIDIADRIADLATTADDALAISGALAQTTSTADDSLAIADAMGDVSGLEVADSFTVADVADADLTSDIPESLSIADQLAAVGLVYAESLAAAAAHANADLNNARMFPNVVVSNSGWVNPNNLIDTNLSTFTSLSATSSGTLGTGGTQNTTNGTIVVSCPNVTIELPDIDIVQLNWSVTVATTGVQLTAGQCNINYQYSLDDGGSWTTFFAQTAQNQSTSSLNITGAVGDDWTKINQLRFRATGSVLSGTGLLPVSTTAQFHYALCDIFANGIPGT